MFQTQVNRFLARGIEGEYADDSPRREQGYILLANTIDGAAATGSLAFAANPADGDTVTIGSVVYRFKDTLAQANDIKIGTAVANTLASLEKTINGDGEEGTDYFAGTTTPLSIVTASVSSQTLNLTATEAGIAGNLHETCMEKVRFFGYNINENAVLTAHIKGGIRYDQNYLRYKKNIFFGSKNLAYNVYDYTLCRYRLSAHANCRLAHNSCYLAFRARHADISHRLVSARRQSAEVVYENKRGSHRHRPVRNNRDDGYKYLRKRRDHS